MAQVCHDNRHVRHTGGCQCGGYSSTSQSIPGPLIYPPTTVPSGYYETTSNQKDISLYDVAVIAKGAGALGVSIAEIIKAIKSPVEVPQPAGSDNVEKPQTTDSVSGEATSQPEQNKPVVQQSQPTLNEQIAQLHDRLHANQNKNQIGNSVNQQDNQSQLLVEIQALHAKLHPEEQKTTTSNVSAGSVQTTSATNQSEDVKTTSKRVAFEKALNPIDYSQTKDAYVGAVTQNNTDKIESYKLSLNNVLEKIATNENIINAYLKAYGSDGDGSMSVADEKRAKAALKDFEQAKKDIEQTINNPKGLKPTEKEQEIETTLKDKEHDDSTALKGEIEVINDVTTPLQQTTQEPTVEFGPVNKPAEDKQMSIEDAKAAAKAANKVLAQTHNLEDQREAIKAFNNWAKHVINGNASNWQLNDCITSLESLCQPMSNESIFVQDLVDESKELLVKLKEMQFARYFK